MPGIVCAQNWLIQWLLPICKNFRKRTEYGFRFQVHEKGDRNPVLASIANHIVLKTLVSTVSYDLQCISNVDNEWSANWRDMNPAINIVFSHVKSPDVILEEDSECWNIWMTAYSHCVFRIRTHRIVVEVALLEPNNIRALISSILLTFSPLTSTCIKRLMRTSELFVYSSISSLQAQRKKQNRNV